MIRGILFDFNGTLFYDSDKHISAFQRFFINRGLEAPSADYIAKKTFGRTNYAIFPDIYKKDASEDDLRRYDLEKEFYYREACKASPDTFHLASGVPEMLDYLKEKNIPFNMATGSGEENVKFYFEYLDIGRWFDYDKIVFDNGTLPGKPEPDGYIEAAKKIGLRADECVVFEDGTSGIISANRAGAGAVIAVISPTVVSPVTADTRVDGEIEDFRGYMDILRKFGI